MHHDRTGGPSPMRTDPGGAPHWATVLPSARLRRLAPVLDLAALALFVAIGRESHGIGSGLGWYVKVLWPFVAGWFAVALVVRLYTATSQPWVRLVTTWGLGIALGLVLRAGITHRESLSTFTVVVYVFTGLMTFGWRAVVLGVRRLVPVTRG
jgi:hypothetical protein